MHSSITPVQLFLFLFFTHLFHFICAEKRAVSDPSPIIHRINWSIGRTRLSIVFPPVAHWLRPVSKASPYQYLPKPTRISSRDQPASILLHSQIMHIFSSFHLYFSSVTEEKCAKSHPLPAISTSTRQTNSSLLFLSPNNVRQYEWKKKTVPIPTSGPVQNSHGSSELETAVSRPHSLGLLPTSTNTHTQGYQTTISWNRSSRPIRSPTGNQVGKKHFLSKSRERERERERERDWQWTRDKNKQIKWNKKKIQFQPRYNQVNGAGSGANFKVDFTGQQTAKMNITSRSENKRGIGIGKGRREREREREMNR